MVKIFFQACLISLLSLCLLACVTTKTIPHQTITPKMGAELQSGQRYFVDGYYKRAMNMLLPLAVDGVAEAEYAVGYMYYYGLGVGQDTDVGYFWIQRAANQSFEPAAKALDLINSKKDQELAPQTKKQHRVL